MRLGIIYMLYVIVNRFNLNVKKVPYKPNNKEPQNDNKTNE